MEIDFDHVINRQESDSDKWHQYGEDVLPLWVADMDFPSPEPVLRALHQRIEHGVFGYPEAISIRSKNTRALVEAIIERMWERYHWEIQPEDLVFLPGIVMAFNLACHALAVPNGGVLVQTPVYPPFLSAPGNAGLNRQEIGLTYNNDGRYILDLDAFEKAFTPETCLFLLCNPHNPVGRVFRQNELLKMAEICLQKGVAICSDEIHCDLVYSDHQHIPIASLDPEIARHTITLMAPSKTFNLAGLQCSFAIIPNPILRRKFQQSKKGLVGWVNLMGYTAALAAYREGGEWLEQLMVYLEDNRNYLYEYVKQELPKVRIALPEATYLGWLDCSEAIQSNPYEFFLHKAKVALSDGKIFGHGGEGFVRLNFGCPRSILRQALERMKDALTREIET